MRAVMMGLATGFGVAVLAAPAAADDRDFFLQFDGITSEDGRSSEWVPATSWFWGEYEVADGAPKVDATLQNEGFFDTGNVRINGSFAGCEVGKSAPEAVLKTPGVRYIFQDVVITKCKPTSLTFNYGEIRERASW